MTPTPASGLPAQFAAAVAALSGVSRLVADFRDVDDAGLIELSRMAAREKQLADAHLALVAGEIAARSERSFGHDGLAQREGFRSAEEFVKATTGSSGRDSSTAVRVGRLVRDAAGLVDPVTGEITVPGEPWLSAVAAAVAAGRVSVGAADAIRAGLGVPTDNVSGGALARAASQLCDLAASVDVDRLLRCARELRDDLDAAGIADRERERFEKRSLKHYRTSSGMGRLVWDLDPESYAVVTELYDRATSPKRGVRFVNAAEKDTAEQIAADPRSIEQLASDTLLALLQAGAAADPSRMIGKGAASVRILVTATTLETATGHARIEGAPDPVSVATAERLLCDGGSTRITLDHSGTPLDVGAEHRLFTPKQRIALAVRDGGCLFGTCTSPPSMTEAHHITPWAAGGRTDLSNGILLCKFHHLLIHNNGWQIRRTGDQHHLIPPADIDPQRQPRPMPSKSAALRDLMRERGVENDNERRSAHDHTTTRAVA